MWLLDSLLTNYEVIKKKHTFYKYISEFVLIFRYSYNNIRKKYFMIFSAKKKSYGCT